MSLSHHFVTFFQVYEIIGLDTERAVSESAIKAMVKDDALTLTVFPCGKCGKSFVSKINQQGHEARCQADKVKNPVPIFR